MADMGLRVKLAAQTAELDTAIQGLLADLRRLGAEAKASMASAGVGSDAFVEKLQRVGVNVTAVNRQLMESGQKANQAVAGNAMATSSIAAQFNDIGVMMASGQNPLIMAIQQGTQLSQALGPAGAAGKLAALRAGFMAFLSPTTLATIALIAGAGALVQWGMKAVGAGEKTKTLATLIKDLETAQRDYDGAARAAAVPMTELIARYKDHAAAVRDSLVAEKELAGFTRDKALADVIANSGLTTQMEPQNVISVSDGLAAWQPYFAEIERRTAEAISRGATEGEAEAIAIDTFLQENPTIRVDQALRGASEFYAQISAIQAKVGGTREEAEQLAVAIARWQTSATNDDRVVNAVALKDVMEDVLGGTEGAAKKAGDLYKAVVATIPVAAAVAAEADGMGSSFEAAAKKADKIGDALKRVGDLSKSSDDLVMARLNLQYDGDSIGLAAAKAGVEFDRARKGSEGADPTVLAYLERERQAYIANAVESEKYRQALEALHAEQKAGADAGAALADLQREADLRAVILRFGENSLEAEGQRVVMARAVFAEQVAGWQATKGISEEMAQALKDAWDAANGLAGVDMKSGIAGATQQALLLASALGIALDKAIAIENAGRPTPPPAARLGFGLEPAQDSVIGGAAELQFGDLSRQAGGGSRDSGFDPRPGRIWADPAKGGGGGGGARETLASIQKEAQEVLATLDRQLATIREKVRAGLMTEADAQEAMTRGRETAANQLAEIIPRLDAMGAAGAKAAEAWRMSLQGLAGELRKTGGDLAELTEEAFKSPFAALIRGAGEAQGAVDRMADRILDRLAEIASDQLWSSLVQPLVGSVFGGVFSGLSGGSGLTFEAQGDVFDAGRIVPFAAGGVPFAPLSAWRNAVVSRPTLFPMARGLGLMGEAGREAILPLTGSDMVRAIGPDGVELAVALTRSRDGSLAVQVPAGGTEPAAAFARGGVPDRLRTLIGQGPGKPSPPPGWTFDPMQSGIMREIASYGARDADGHWLKGGLPPGAAAAADRSTAAAAAGRVTFAPKVVTNVTTPPGHTATVSEGAGGGADGLTQIVDVIVEAVDRRLAGNFSTGRGASTAALAEAFGLKRRPR